MDNVTIGRLSRRMVEGDLYRSLGRFKQVRWGYSLYQNLSQQLQPEAYKERLHPKESSLVESLSPARHVKEMHKNGVSFGLRLPAEEVEKVYQYAIQNPCKEPGFDDVFYAREVKSGRLNGGRNVFRGLVENPENCPTVKALSQDPTLLEIVRGYLNYWPTKLTYHLTWSFVVDLDVQKQKEIYPPLNYHYDVAGYNFMTSYFYITDIDAQSGAHVMFDRSHNKKPINTLFSSGAAPKLAQQIADYYGADNERVIEGPAGFGFVQDPSCFHKLLPPLKNRRLLLQIRYA